MDFSLLPERARTKMMYVIRHILWEIGSMHEPGYVHCAAIFAAIIAVGDTTPEISKLHNRSGSKIPNRGWSVSRYKDMILAATSSEIETKVQKLMFNSSKHSSQGGKVDIGCLMFVGRCAEN